MFQNMLSFLAQAAKVNSRMYFTFFCIRSTMRNPSASTYFQNIWVPCYCRTEWYVSWRVFFSL